jgi:hypothetical protein
LKQKVTWVAYKGIRHGATDNSDMTALSSNEDGGEQRPWAEVWPDCSPEDEATQSRTGRTSRKVGLQIGASKSVYV